MEVDSDYKIRQVYGRFNSLPPKAVYIFLKEYAQSNWLYYDPYELISDSLDVEDYLEGDKDLELRDYILELKDRNEHMMRENVKDTTKYVQLGFDDYVAQPMT